MTTPTVNHKAGGTLALNDKGKLELTGDPYYKLPVGITEAFVQEWLAQDFGSEFFMGVLMEHVLPAHRRFLGKQCQEMGGDTWRKYAKLACSWAPLLNTDNHWHFDQLNVVYEQVLPTELVSKVYVSDLNFRLVETPRGILSFEEFRYRYGKSLENYLLLWRSQMDTAISEVLIHGFSPLKRVKASVLDKENRTTYVILVGPETLDLEFWRVPHGYTLLTVE